MKWIQSKDRLPEKDKYVLFDFMENPPMYGKIEIYPGGTFITTMDSSGEEESDHLDMDSQWLDESEIPTPESRRPTESDYEEIVGMVENAKEANDKYYAEEGARAAIQWLQTSGVREGTERELKERLRELVEGYESWEAELISDNRCWGPEGMNSYPTLTKELYDKMIELQEKRNEAKSLLSKTI